MPIATHVVPFRDVETWVRVTTPTTPTPDALPLFVLHGGPGMAHDYVRNIADLADETGRTVVHYDQIGCGRSTHLPDALREFWEPGQRPPTSGLIFLTTHEPCTLCMSAITWAGFDNYYYFYSHEDSRDSFAIPHDLVILKELFGLEAGGYRRTNAFWTAYSIPALIESQDEPLRTRLRAQQQRIRDRYQALSDQYQESKGDNDIPLS